MRNFGRAVIATAAVALVVGATGVHAEEWEWEIAPYAWLSDVGVDVSLNETDIASVTVDFSDLLDKADLLRSGLLESDRKDVGADIRAVEDLIGSGEEKTRTGTSASRGRKRATAASLPAAPAGGTASPSLSRGLGADAGISFPIRPSMP